MTLTEMGQRMTQGELQTWVAYVEENGPLNPMLRMEAMLAKIASPFFKNSKPKDWMTWPRLPEPDATPEALLSMFKNLSAASKRKH
jgi:hypothetical protein